MMSPFPLLLVSILFSALQAKQFTKCSLSQELNDLAGYRNITLPEWICIIFHISGYDTQTIIRNNGNTEYGLFQINDKDFCDSSQNLQSRNICDISCDKFLDDDLTDDIMCAKKILDIKGIDHWLAHKPLCSDKLEQWYCKVL
ncbi:Alpha-lactalbumin [Heterocephalus glaber]|uniref:Alpha-lactalbumin n=1 Tax=Heterocephalus glaber TaxID=10181 RepID=G5AU48_HETGA|nr:alpha-lactalbumin [Heterocephalus glaber]EHB00559.1 Alpha-lactalbumin [Heterocephalus glaber]